MLLRESAFLKSECKSTNYFRNYQIFREKSLEINSILTIILHFMKEKQHNSLVYTCIVRTHVWAHRHITE